MTQIVSFFLAQETQVAFVLKDSQGRSIQKVL
jgi:hypothetical protein